MFSRIHSAVGCVNLLSHKSSASSSAAAAQSPITSSDPQLESLINLDPEPEDSACLMSEKLSNVHDPTVEPDDSPFRSSVPADDTLVCDGSPSAGPETVTDDISPCIIVPVMMSVVGSKTVSATPVVWCGVASLLTTNSLKSTSAAISPCSTDCSTQTTITRASRERASQFTFNQYYCLLLNLSINMQMSTSSHRVPVALSQPRLRHCPRHASVRIMVQQGLVTDRRTDTRPQHVAR